MSAEEIATLGGGEVPFFRAPEPATLFAERQMRLTQLARGHALADYLLLMAAVAKSQHRLLAAGGSVVLPDAATLAAARAAGKPALAIERLPRTSWWRDVLRAIIDDVAPTAPVATRAALSALRNEPDDTLERRADDVLREHVADVDLAAAPFVGAALQVYWVHALSQLHARVAAEHGDAIVPGADLSHCPACGSRPIASITRTINNTPGHRYLHCSLCSGEWHRVRTDCTCCGASTALAYQSLDYADGGSDVASQEAARASLAAVQAETCDACQHYVKIMHTDRDPMVEVGADDLAGVTLDLLVSETGKHRFGRNLMLLFSDEARAAPPVPADPGAT